MQNKGSRHLYSGAFLKHGLAMRTFEYEQIIVRALKGLEGAFDKNELAYLALTSKPELPVRDRLAYQMYREFRERTHNVAREWGRVDIALLERDQPRICIQLKAWSLFTFIDRQGARRHRVDVEEDIDKCRSRFGSEPKVYSLILATHVGSPPEGCQRGVLKYLNGLKRSFDRFGTSRRIKEQAFAQRSGAFAGWRCAGMDTIHGGQAFGSRVFVFYWLFGPH